MMDILSSPMLDNLYQVDLILSVIVKTIAVICLLLWIPTRGEKDEQRKQ